MAHRIRIYKTDKLSDGRRMVTSCNASDFLFIEAIKLICKIMFYCMFFWIIIPVKIFKKK